MLSRALSGAYYLCDGGANIIMELMGGCTPLTLWLPPPPPSLYLPFQFQAYPTPNGTRRRIARDAVRVSPLFLAVDRKLLIAFARAPREWSLTGERHQHVIVSGFWGLQNLSLSSTPSKWPQIPSTRKVLEADCYFPGRLPPRARDDARL